jgi:serine/threonine protein kinase
MPHERTFAVSMSGASYTGLWSVQKSGAGKYMVLQKALPPSSGGAFVMNITPRYELLRREPLGEGAYGSVWLCQERRAAAAHCADNSEGSCSQPPLTPTRQNQRLVVKCVAFMANAAECRRMLREVNLMSTLRHPHVSSAVDAWTWKPPGQQPLQLCIVSPFGGCSLLSFLSRFDAANPLPESTARSIVLQLAAATTYLHSVATIHRDLKSENCLVQELPNGQVTVRIIDFGLARVLAPLQAAPDAIGNKNDGSGGTDHHEHCNRSDLDRGDDDADAAADDDDDDDDDNDDNYNDDDDNDDDDNDDDQSIEAMMKRDRDEDRKRMGFNSEPPPTGKAARIDCIPKRVTIREPITQPPLRTDSGGRSKRAQMTRHVVTHWYRPPELFANSDANAEYDATVDVWSLGCIFAEIMYRVHPPAVDRSADKWCGVLFRFNEDDVGAFLHEVMMLCGAPSAADVAAMKRQLNAKDASALDDIVAAAWFCEDSIDRHPVFSKASPQARDLLRKSLQFNPRNRLSAEEFYCHPYLGGSRAVLHEMAGGHEQLSATLHENLALKLEDQTLERSHLQEKIAQACAQLQQRRKDKQ